MANAKLSDRTGRRSFEHVAKRNAQCEGPWLFAPTLCWSEGADIASCKSSRQIFSRLDSCAKANLKRTQEPALFPYLFSRLQSRSRKKR
jgi:hypothetical protein